MLFVGKSAVAVLDASAKYLRCMGFFYWSLGILNVARMVTQGLGYSGRAVFSGVTEMIARTVVCLGFVVTFGFTAICFADQTAWITATCYIFQHVCGISVNLQECLSSIKSPSTFKTSKYKDLWELKRKENHRLGQK